MAAEVGADEGNAARVREILERFSAGEDFVSELHSPEIAYVNPPDAVDPGIRHGEAGWRAAMRELRESAGVERIDVLREQERGDTAAVETELVYHMRGSDTTLSARRSSIWTFRDGLAVRLEWFTDPEEAFERLRSAGGR